MEMNVRYISGKKIACTRGHAAKIYFLLVQIICKIHLKGATHTHIHILCSLYRHSHLTFTSGNVFSKCMVAMSGAEAEL